MHSRSWIAILSVSVIGCLCFYGYLLRPDITLAGMDFLNLHYPRAVLIQREFWHGRIPLWNPYEWGGCPLLAAMQGSVLYPPTWLFVLLPQPYGLQISIFLHVLWACIGTALFAMALLGCEALPACFAGLAYAGSGFFAGRIEQANIVAAFSWTPWIWLAGLRALRGKGSWTALSVAIAMSLLAGHPQMTLLALIAGVVLVAAYAVLNIRGRQVRSAVPRGPAQFAFAASAIAAGCSVAAAQLIPTQELAGLSERVWPYPDPMEPALKWSYLQALAIPRYYNHLTGTIGKPLGYTELGLYCGIVTLCLAVAGLFLGSRRRSKAVLALLGCWIFCMLYALGSSGGVAWMFLKSISFLGHSRGAARMLNCATLCIALLASFGLQSLSKMRTFDARKAKLVSAAALLLLIADLTITQRPELQSTVVDSEFLTSKSGPGAQIAGTGASAYRFMQNDADYYLDNSSRAVLQREQRAQPNLTSVFKLHVLDGYEEGLLPTRAWANFIRRYNRNLRSDRVDPTLLSLIGTSYMLTDYAIPDFGPVWAQIRSQSNLTLWQNTYPAVKAVAATASETLSALRSQLDQDFSEASSGKNSQVVNRDGYLFAPLNTQAVSHSFSHLTPQQMSSLSCATSKWISSNEEQLTLIRAVTDSIFVMQSAFPGWAEKLPNQGLVQQLIPRTVISSELRISHPVPAGTTIELVYAPFSFRIGLFISLAALMLLCLLRFSKHGLTRNRPTVA